MQQFLKYFSLFSIGGLIYMLIEVLFSGSTHWTMGILGGICFILIGLINSCFDWPLYKQMFAGSLIITILEFTAGVYLNLYLHLDIWDYSRIPLNILGQVCLPFSCLWFLLTLPAILLNGLIRSALFGEPHHSYKFF